MIGTGDEPDLEESLAFARLLVRALIGAVLLIVALALTGCMAPPEDRPLEPRPEYPMWYLEVETCAGVRGDYNALRFFLLDRDDIHAGVTKGTTIWLRYPDSFSRVIVEHEMLHSLIDDGAHLDPRWVRCGLSPAQIQAMGEE